ncbi:hypothetical protein DY000_02018155 [Brassica cretica]|uniref:DUF547 domain-containing protein n=1 Tax=Brassica cretica TaxID=69181 RepID=A0ABQ7D3D4_BRACR|nr:hypothetical protein DY000_02018155 [Brassica cretica]
MIIRKLYGIETTDPNIIFALSCGTRSSPAVRIYTGDGVATELEKSKMEYLQASVVVTEAKRVILPELLVKHAADFVGARADSSCGEMGYLVKWVCNQLPTSGSLRKSMVDCLKNLNSKASSSISGGFFITWFSSSTHLKVFQIWKTSGLEDFQTTFRKSSRRVPGSLLTEFSPMSPFHNRSERFGFTDLGLIYMFFKSGSDFGRLMGSLLKYNALEDFQEVFQTTSRKSSDGVFFHIKWSLSLSL